MDFSGAKLTRSALGKMAFIGELYDARSESYSSRSIFGTPLPQTFIKYTNMARTSFDYRFIEKVSDSLDLLNVEADLRVSLLCGFLSGGISGKYINRENESRNVVRMLLKSTHNTISEKLFGSFDAMKPHLDLVALQDPQYTHVVVSADWGANCFLNFEKKCDTKENKKEAKGRLNAGIQNLLKIFKSNGEGYLIHENDVGFVDKDVVIKIEADFTAEGETPISIESFIKLMLEVPTLLKKVNEGKGKPLSYELIPLSTFRKIAQVDCQIEELLIKIKETFTFYVVSLFEDIAVARQKLQDLRKEIRQYESYIHVNVDTECDYLLKSLKLKESNLKALISENWISVRTGRLPIEDLEKKINKFVSENLNLTSYDEYLCHIGNPARSKIQQIENFSRHGANYLKKDENICDKFTNNPLAEFVILVISDEFKKVNSELFICTTSYFLSLSEEKFKKNKTEYLVVDLDVVDSESNKVTKDFFSNLGIDKTRCLKMKNGLVECPDLYANHLKQKESNFARPRKESKTCIDRQKPNARALLQIVCPGSLLKTCPSDQVSWDCYFCKQSVEYGFDDHFYCSCGKISSYEYEFRCGHPGHGISTFVPGENEFIKKQLALLRPFDEMNILILGQTGVGKSTWINSMVNYFYYESLQEAKENGVICTIPTKVVVCDPETFEHVEFDIGEKENSEDTSIGNSATQNSSSYTFFFNKKLVRIIDTPGLADTRGMSQDKINLKCVIDQVSYLKELHGLCILLNANDTRITYALLYTLKEFLIHLPKSFTNNIVFCYTNARSTCYTPGKMGPILNKTLTDFGVVDKITLGRHNSFVLDNEAFLYLCQMKCSKFKYDEIIESSYDQSWRISVRETKRLFSTIETFEPRDLKNLSALYTARTKILALSRPVAEISKTIQINLSALDKWREQVELSEMTISELEKTLYIQEIHLESIPLNYPRTVCTSPSCVEYHTLPTHGVTEIEYIKHCHTRCYLKDVLAKTTNNVELKKCQAMNPQGTCKVCNCSWAQHMHLTYDQKRVTGKAINEKTKIKVDNELSKKEKKQKLVEELEEKISSFKNEQAIITKISAKLGLFLKENAIAVYNDSVEEYLTYLIHVEKNKPHKTEQEEELLKNLELTLVKYRGEVEILNKALAQNEREIPKVDEIQGLVEKLYSLKIMGNDIKQNTETSLKSLAQMLDYNEKPLRMPTKKNKEKTCKSPNGIMGTIKNYWPFLSFKYK